MMALSQLSQHLRHCFWINIDFFQLLVIIIISIMCLLSYLLLLSIGVALS